MGMISDFNLAIYLYIARADDSTPSVIIGGYIIPSGIAMREANEWAAQIGLPVPYPYLGEARGE